MFMVVGLTAVAGACILVFIMYVTDKFELIFVPMILIAVGIVCLILASVARYKYKKTEFDANVKQQMNYAPRPYSVDPFFTIDPFADAFTDKMPGESVGAQSEKTEKFCINCGAPRQSGDKFCPFCGKKYE